MKKSDKFENTYIAVLAIMIAIVIAIIGLNVYSSMQEVESNITLDELAEHTANDIESASSSIGNNVGNSVNNSEQNSMGNNTINDVQTSSQNTQENENVTRDEHESNVSNSTEQTNETNSPNEYTQGIVENTDESLQNEGIENEEAVNTSIESENIKNEPLTFIKPVDGEIIKQFAKDSLVYSDTLLEWTTHLGIDIKAEKTTVVKAAAEGTIKSIKNDPRYGLTVIIEHKDGYQTVYSNLLSSEFIIEGESVSQGQSIGTVGNTATFEIADETHLHFELLQNGVYLDPTIYVK